MKTENLMYGHFGNGVSICDRNREEYNDYRIVAHIDYNRKVQFYANDLSDDAKIEIENMAQFGNMAVSVCTPDVFALRPLTYSSVVTETLHS